MAFMSGRLLEVCPNQASGSLLPQALRIILSVGKRGEGPGAVHGECPGAFLSVLRLRLLLLPEVAGEGPAQGRRPWGEARVYFRSSVFPCVCVCFFRRYFFVYSGFGEKEGPLPSGEGRGKGPMGVPVRGGDYSRESRTSESEVGMLGSKNFGAEALSMLRSLSTRSASSAVPMLRFKSWSS